MARWAGVDLVPYPAPDLGPWEVDLLRKVGRYTMTEQDRIIALAQATRYVVRRKIPGCIVECGVWKGGSMMAVAYTLIDEKDTIRDLYLYDTFEGMVAPGQNDRSFDGRSAESQLAAASKGTERWCEASLNEVRANLRRTGYPAELIHYAQGPVEATLPAQSPPGPIALLRLDTDWYQSTLHELTHLFPLLQPGGILLIDDYGHWEGARKATDEYLATLPQAYLLHRIDYTGRMLVK